MDGVAAADITAGASAAGANDDDDEDADEADEAVGVIWVSPIDSTDVLFSAEAADET